MKKIIALLSIGFMALHAATYDLASGTTLPSAWCKGGTWRIEGKTHICSGYIEANESSAITAPAKGYVIKVEKYNHNNRHKGALLTNLTIGSSAYPVEIQTIDGSIELERSTFYGDLKAGKNGRISFSQSTFHGKAITKGKISSSNDTFKPGTCLHAGGQAGRGESFSSETHLRNAAFHIYRGNLAGSIISGYGGDIVLAGTNMHGNPHILEHFVKIQGDGSNTLRVENKAHVHAHIKALGSIDLQGKGTQLRIYYEGALPPVSGKQLKIQGNAPFNLPAFPCGNPDTAPTPTQGNFRVVETGNSWNQDKIKTKVFGNALSFDILHSTDNGTTLTEGKIKRLELWDHSGATPQRIQTILNAETTITNGKLSVPIPALAKPYKHLKFHIIADDTNGIEQTTLSDSFALRPARFELKALKKPTESSPCDESAASSTLKAKAGEEFCLFAYATNPAGNPIAGYNAGLGASDSLEIAYKEPKPKLRTGELSPNPSEQAFTDGKLILPKVHYSEVGKPNITLKERENQEWALVDKDDTPDDERLIAPATIQPEFTLARFGFKDLKLTSKFDGNFSFFDLLPNPSVTPIPNSKLLTLSYTLQAQNEQGQVTKNYVQGGYAKPATLTRTLPTGIILPEGTKLIHETQGSEPKIYPENQNEALTQLPDLTPTFPLNLPAGIPDATTANDPKAGTQTFTEEFSFAAPRTKPANPIKFHGAQPLALEAKETGDPNIKGEASITNDMTLYFARINALDSYEEGGNVKSKVYYEVYCKGRISDECQGFDKANYSVNSAYWYKFKFGIDPDAEGSYTTGTVEDIENNDSVFREELALKPDHFKVDSSNRYIKPSHIEADPDGSGFFVVLEFSDIATDTRRQGRIEHGDGKFPAFFYFHPYRDYKAGDTFTTFIVSKTKNPDNKENVVKTDSAKNARGASRVGD